MFSPTLRYLRSDVVDMIVGILSVRNHRYHPNKRLLDAARDLGHQAILVHPGKLFMGVGGQGLTVDHLTRDFRADVIIPRLGSTIKEYAMTMVYHFELLGVPVINPLRSILLARNKFQALQTLSRKGIPVPESRYVSNWSNFDKAVSTLGSHPFVIKTAYGRQGRGVLLIESVEKSKDLLDRLLNRRRGLLIQRFIPPENRREIRIMVTGERIIGAMSLKPRKTDFRANIHLNSRAEKIRLTKEMSLLAIASTKALGLDISGVDMIEKDDGSLCVVDVNYSPGFKGLERCTGKDIASEMIKFVAGSLQ